MQRTKRFLVVFAAVLGLCAPLAHAAQYTYDQRGRLTGVTESDGSTISYTYDANGNILSITRTSATLPLTIATFSPSSGAVGASVIIRGTGFNPVAGQNAVTFNGVAAVVTSANATTIVVTVPAGASTGLISVSAAGNTATSVVSFTVTTLEITNFTPKIGPVGTQVVIDGNGFDQTITNNVVKFNTTTAVVSAATTTQLTVAVPTGATSGRVRVTAPSGSAASADDFIVPPGTFSAAQVAMAGRLTPSGPGLVFTVNATNKTAVALFDGAVGERLSLVFFNVSMFGTWRVYAPDGSLLTWSGLASGITTIDLGPLTQAGTYSFVMVPTTDAGSATIRVVSDALGTLSTDGTPNSMSLAAGQNAMLNFNGVAGESYNFVVTNYTSSPDPYSINASLLRADGSNVKNCSLGNGSVCHFDIADTGVYSLRLDGYGLNATTFEARLNTDFRATLVPNSPIDIQLDKQGQNALLSFAVATGQDVTLNLASIVTTPANQAVLVRVFNAAGTQVTLLSSSSGNWTLNLPGLAAGAYTMLVVPANAATATFRAGIVAAQPVALASNGATTPFSATFAAQTAYFSFSGAQGQNLALGLTSLGFASGAVGTPWVQVLRPDGTQLATANCSISTGRCQIPLRNLPASGAYRIEVVVNQAEKVSFGITLSQSVTGTMTPGTPVDLTFASPGQNAVLTFTVSTAQTLALSVGSMNLNPAGSPVMTRVFNPAGSQINWASSSTAASLSLPNLAAGTYTVTIDPTAAGVGTVQATLTQGTPVPLDGSAVGFTASSAGQTAYFTFAGTAGQNLGVGLTNLALSPGSPTNANLRVYRPDNTQVTSINCNIANTGCQVTLRNLPTTGTYRIEVEAATSQTMSFNLRISPAAGGAISLSATPMTANLDIAGQFAQYTFVATAGQVVTVRLGPVTMTPANSQVVVRVYNPSDSQILSTNVATTPATLNLTNLVAGTYTVTVVPTYAATGSAQVTIATGLTGTLTSNGTTTNYSTSVAGQIGYFTFSGTSGANLGLGITGLSLTPSSPTTANVRIYKPDNTQLTSVNCATTQTGCQIAMRALTATGTYRVEIEPGAQQSASYALTLSQSSGSALTPSTTSVPVTFSVPGQNAQYTFTATAGQIVAVRLAGTSMAPANSDVAVRVYNPSGSQILSGNATTTGVTLNLTNLVAGTYSISVVPTYAATGSAQLTLAPGLTGAHTADGTTTNYNAVVAGQVLYASYSGTVGQNFGLGLTGLVLTPASPTTINVRIYKPDNTQLTSINCTTANTGCALDLRNLPATGTYRIEAEQGAQQTASYGLTLSQSVSGTLAAGTPLPISLTSPGQTAVLTFTATAGQSIPVTLATPSMTPAGSQVIVRAYNPSGGQFASGNATTGPVTLNLNNLSAGTYTVLVMPTYAATGTLQLSRP